MSHVKASDLEVVSQLGFKPTIFFIFQNNHQHEPLPGDLENKFYFEKYYFKYTKMIWNVLIDQLFFPPA